MLVNLQKFLNNLKNIAKQAKCAWWTKNELERKKTEMVEKNFNTFFLLLLFLYVLFFIYYESRA